MVLAAEEKNSTVLVRNEIVRFGETQFRREHGCDTSETPHNNAISRIVQH